jgi:hypothetical protein
MNAMIWPIQVQEVLSASYDSWQYLAMSKTSPKKTKRGDERVTTYVRVKSEEHALIVQIAEKRGWPHTIASVAAEMISRGLKAEVETTAPGARP